MTFLGIRSSGRNPDELRDDVFPVIDLTPYYLPGRLGVVTSATTTSGAAGAIATVTVPDGRIWNVLGFGVQFTATSLAGSIYNCMLRMRDVDAGTAMFVDRFDQLTTTATNEQWGFAHSFPQPFVAPPGWRFEARVTIANAPETITFTSRVLRHEMVA